MKFKLASSIFASVTFSGISTNIQQAAARHATKLNAYNCAYSQNTSNIEASLGNPSLAPHVFKKYFPIAKIPLAYGGYKQIFDINGQMTEVLVTPKHFNALIAPEEELHLYGIPDRPTDEKQLKTWEQNWQNYQGGPVPYMIGAKLTENSSDLSTPSSTDPAQNQTTSSQQPIANTIPVSNQPSVAGYNWSGYVVHPPKNHKLSYVSADMQMQNIADNPDECPNHPWAASEWVGLGGFGYGHEYFIQAGEVQQQARSGLFSIFSTSPFQGPFYEYFNPTDSGEIVFPCMYYDLADWWNFSILYNSDSNGTFYLTAHDLSEKGQGVSFGNPTPNGACPASPLPNGKQPLYPEVTIALTNMSNLYNAEGPRATADWAIEQPARGSNGGSLYALGNFNIAQVKNAEAGYFKTSNQSGSLHNPYNFKLGTMGLYGCYNSHDEGEIGSCNKTVINTINAQGQPSTTVIPTPGKQGFDVEWHNCGLYSESHKPVVGKAE